MSFELVGDVVVGASEIIETSPFVSVGAAEAVDLRGMASGRGMYQTRGGLERRCLLCLNVVVGLTCLPGTVRPNVAGSLARYGVY